MLETVRGLVFHPGAPTGEELKLRGGMPMNLPALESPLGESA